MANEEQNKVAICCNQAKEKTVPTLKECILTGVVLDFLLLLLASTIMDAGTVFLFTFCMTVGHWLGNTLILVRRRRSLTRFDRDFLRFGLLMMVLPAGLLSYVLFAL